MLIYTPIITNRCRYIFDTLISQLLGIDFALTEDHKEFEEFRQEKFSYNLKPFTGALSILATDLLFSSDIKTIEIKTFAFENCVAFFETPESDFPFDIFAASFYLLSRYEEYLPSKRDEHARFPAGNSLGFKNGFLEIPVINYWVASFQRLLLSRYPGLPVKKMLFKATISFDIDVAYAYRGRSVWQNILAITADLLLLRFKNLGGRLNVIIKGAQDPYDTYEYIISLLNRYSNNSIFFFLLTKNRTTYDRNISPGGSCLQQIIKNIASRFETGIHPSYYSSEKKELLIGEKKTLEKICGKPVTSSRQHFLRFNLPDTYRQLLQAGITDDYSMGYADQPGFRAGIAYPFYFFDLLSGSQTKLKIHPISFMEGSFMKGKQNDSQMALEHIKKIIAAVKDVNGCFLCLWHNHTISEMPAYKNWRKVFEEMMIITALP